MFIDICCVIWLSVVSKLVNLAILLVLSGNKILFMFAQLAFTVPINHAISILVTLCSFRRVVKLLFVVVKSDVFAFNAKLLLTSDVFAFNAKLLLTSDVFAFNAKLN